MHNKGCEFFPCHNTKSIDADEFNCLFCFCPLYNRDDCGGTFSYLKNGCKDCSLCVLPHMKDNYGLIVERLRGSDAKKVEKNAV